MGAGKGMERLSQAGVKERVGLPKPRTTGEMAVEEAIQRRRSVREFSGEALGLAEVSQLLWSAQGVTSARGLRAAPSAGARYPLEVYLVCAEGLFQYEPGEHALMKVGGEDLREALAEAALGQGFVAEAPVSLVFSAVYERTMQRYGERGIRYAHVDLGHAAENVHLQGEAMGLGSCAVGALDDAAVGEVLGLSGQERPLYIIPVGRPRRG